MNMKKMKKKGYLPFCLGLLVVLASSNTGWCAWANYDEEFSAAPTNWSIGGPTDYTYTWNVGGTGYGQVVYTAWPQLNTVPPYGACLWNTPGDYLTRFDGSTAQKTLPVTLEFKFDLSENASQWVGPSFGCAVAGWGYIGRFRYYNAGGAIVNDDIWCSIVNGPAVVFSALGCPASIYTADPVTLRVCFTAGTPTKVRIGAATATESWAIEQTALGNVAWTGVGHQMYAWGSQHTSGSPKAADATDVTNGALAPLKIDFIRWSNSLLPVGYVPVELSEFSIE